MSDFHKHRNIRLINNVIAHEVGHLIANLLLNKIQDEPKVEEISVVWIEQSKKPGGQIDYSIKEGSNHWKFPDDLNLCYYTILSLYSGCIWEKFFNSIFHKIELDAKEIETCYESSGFSDMSKIGIINNSHLKQSLTKDFTREYIVKPYVELLQNISQEQKKKLYDKLYMIATAVDLKFSNPHEELKYKIKDNNFEELKDFIIKEFLTDYGEALINIVNNIKKYIKLE